MPPEIVAPERENPGLTVGHIVNPDRARLFRLEYFRRNQQYAADNQGVHHVYRVK